MTEATMKTAVEQAMRSTGLSLTVCRALLDAGWTLQTDLPGGMQWLEPGYRYVSDAHG